LEQARARADPPFNPPADFQTGLADLPHLRLSNWRNQLRFPQVHEGWDWLAGMVLRYQQGIPPVTEAEFGQLADWFQANADRLTALARPSGLLDVGGGRTMTVVNLSFGLSDGPRAVHAGEVAEDVRQLRSRYGGLRP
jgi:hypothetical protein